MGRPRKYEGERKTVQVRVSSDLHDALRAHAQATGISINDVCVRALQRYVDGAEQMQHTRARKTPALPAEDRERLRREHLAAAARATEVRPPVQSPAVKTEAVAGCTHKDKRVLNGGVATCNTCGAFRNARGTWSPALTSSH